LLSCENGRLLEPLNCPLFGLRCRPDTGCTPPCSSGACGFCPAGTENSGCPGGDFFPCIDGAQGLSQQCAPGGCDPNFGCF
jgi:hypothetical protein